MPETYRGDILIHKSLGASHISSTVSYHGQGCEYRAFGFTRDVGRDWNVSWTTMKGMRQEELTETPSKENGQGEHYGHHIYCPS
jgi:hypothetical protein